MFSGSVNAQCRPTILRRQTVDVSVSKPENRSVFALLPTQIETYTKSQFRKLPLVRLAHPLDPVPVDLDDVPPCSETKDQLKWGNSDPHETLWQYVLFPPQPTTLFDNRQPWKISSASVQHQSLSKSTPGVIGGQSPFQSRRTIDYKQCRSSPPPGFASPDPALDFESPTHSTLNSKASLFQSDLNPEAAEFDLLPSPAPFSSPDASTTLCCNSPMMGQPHHREQHDSQGLARDASRTSTKYDYVHQSTSRFGSDSRVVFHSRECILPTIEEEGAKCPANNCALTYRTLHQWIMGDREKSYDQARQLIRTASLDELAIIFSNGMLWGGSLDKAILLLKRGDFLSNPACRARSFPFRLAEPGSCVRADMIFRFRGSYSDKKTCLQKLLGVISLDGTEWWVRKDQPSYRSMLLKGKR